MHLGALKESPKVSTLFQEWNELLTGISICNLMRIYLYT